MSLKFEECNNFMIFNYNFIIIILTHFLVLFIYIFIGICLQVLYQYEESMIYLKLPAQMLKECKPFGNAKYRKSERVISVFE